MESLGFYPLSLILSFLEEVDGTCFLITKRYYARSVLPIFRFKREDSGLLVVVNARKHRHKFLVSPVQDPTVLLERLNTRRLRKRVRSSPKEHYTMTTKELAVAEWKKRREQKEEQLESQCEAIKYPPHMELLRLLDHRYDKDEILFKTGVTLLASYPRSGNTLLRTLLEKITGIVTGSDTRPDRTLSKELAVKHNLVGEGITQKTKTCFVKTHWPERVGCRIFNANQGILIVRNPFDAIDSFWNLNVTNTHTESVTDEIYNRFHEQFEALVKNEIQVWYDFNSYWLDKCYIHRQQEPVPKNDKGLVPLLLIRYEDLIMNLENEMSRIFEFIHCQSHRANISQKEKNLSLSFWRKRIHFVLSSNAGTEKNDDKKCLGLYQSGILAAESDKGGDKNLHGIGKSLRKGRYSREMLDYIHKVAASANTKENPLFRYPEMNLLQEFGYDIQELGFPNNFSKGQYAAPNGLFSSESKVITDNKPSENKESSCCIAVNKGHLTRPVNCPFGRDMRLWRRQHTNNDTDPFPTTPRR